MASRRIVPPWNYLREASQPSLESFELSRLNHAANLRKEIAALLEQWIAETAEAFLARWLREDRKLPAPPGQSLDVLPQDQLPFSPAQAVSVRPRRADRRLRLRAQLARVLTWPLGDTQVSSVRRPRAMPRSSTHASQRVSPSESTFVVRPVESAPFPRLSRPLDIASHLPVSLRFFASSIQASRSTAVLRLQPPTEGCIRLRVRIARCTLPCGR